jgi:hypothetical protein
MTPCILSLQATSELLPSLPARLKPRSFNESYYNDIHAMDASASIYVRFGRLPNLSKALVYIVILRKGHPTYQIDLEDAPLPPADDKYSEFNVPGLCWFKHTVVEPLKTARIQVKGMATAYNELVKPHSKTRFHVFASPALPVWGFAGEKKRVPIEFDVTFEHVGTPMTWRITPRWEAPTHGRGKYKIGGEEFSIDGFGQRDQSVLLAPSNAADCLQFMGNARLVQRQRLRKDGKGLACR